MQEMEKILPLAKWKELYSPYSADAYLFNSNTPFLDDLSKVNPIEFLKMYGNSFLKNPFLLTRERLAGTELLWNVSQPANSFNYNYHPKIDQNELGLSQRDNTLKKNLLWILDITSKKADVLLWRAGIYNVLILTLLLLFVRRGRKYLLLFIPVLSCNLSLLISVTHQSYRYVYYVPLLFGFIWFLYLSNIIRQPELKTPTNTNQ